MSTEQPSLERHLYRGGNRAELSGLARAFRARVIPESVIIGVSSTGDPAVTGLDKDEFGGIRPIHEVQTLISDRGTSVERISYVYELYRDQAFKRHAEYDLQFVTCDPGAIFHMPDKFVNPLPMTYFRMLGLLLADIASPLLEDPQS